MLLKQNNLESRVQRFHFCIRLRLQLDMRWACRAFRAFNKEFGNLAGREEGVPGGFGFITPSLKAN